MTPPRELLRRDAAYDRWGEADAGGELDSFRHLLAEGVLAPGVPSLIPGPTITNPVSIPTRRLLPLLCLSFPLVIGPSMTSVPDTLTVSFLDVGEADAAIIHALTATRCSSTPAGRGTPVPR